jgi:hypothetical protein
METEAMTTLQTIRPIARPQPGDQQDYPLFGPGEWRLFDTLNPSQQAQSRALDRQISGPGALCLVAIKSGRVLRVIAG